MRSDRANGVTFVLDLLTQQALRAVVRRVLSDVAKVGSLPGEHHFYVTFDTRAPGGSCFTPNAPSIRWALMVIALLAAASKNSGTFSSASRNTVRRKSRALDSTSTLSLRL